MKKIAKKKLESITDKSEYTQADFLWIKSEQKNELQDVLTELTDLKRLKRKSSKKVRELQLFIDERKIIRSRGRFSNALIEFEAKYPIFLPKPKQSRFVFLLVASIHEKLMHAGVSTTLSNIRRFFLFQMR